MSVEYKSFDSLEEIERAKTLKETDKSCPSCGGTMQFDPSTGGLYCPYCEYRASVIESGEAIVEQDIHRAGHTESFEWGQEKKQIICNSCGAEAIYDALEVANVCPFCGSNHVMDAQMDDSLPPNGVIPFEITAQTAGDNFKKWLKRKWFTPRAAKESARPDAFTGMYMPYWTFDADAHCTYTGEYGIRKTYTKDGKTHTRTDWYPTRGTYERFIDDELVIGTTRHDPVILKRVEPFEFESLKPYNPQYLSGFAAERYSVGLDSALETGKKQMEAILKSDVESKIKREHNASDSRIKQLNASYSNITYKYIVLPLWASAFKFKNKVFQFMVNGQTGKVGGRAPVSPLRVTIAVLIGLAVLALIAYLSSL
ncbi:MAG: hypothetical protein ACOX8S_07575 [Christensenellales bacterium]